jgi:uncharacterized protein (TIGR03067 family)
MKRSLMVGIAAVLLVAADAPKDDMGKLEGRWYGGIWTYNGAPALIVDFNDPMSILDITDSKATLRPRTGPTTYWSYSIPSKGTPKVIDLTVSEGQDKGKTQRGIYKIEANIYNGFYLTICFARPGADRPSEFLYKPEEGQQVYSFARYPKPR